MARALACSRRNARHLAVGSSSHWAIVQALAARDCCRFPPIFRERRFAPVLLSDWVTERERI